MGYGLGLGFGFCDGDGDTIDAGVGASRLAPLVVSASGDFATTGTVAAAVAPLVAAGVGAEFIPTDIAGCKLWLRADLGLTQTLNLVSAWNDQSGTGRNFAQAVPANQPTFLASDINGLPAVQLDSVLKFLQVSTGFTQAQPIDLWLVINQVSWVANRRIIDDTNAGRIVMNQAGTSPNNRIYAQTAFACDNNNATVGSYVVLRAQFNGSSSFMQVNNGTKTTGNPGTAGFTSSIPMVIGTQGGQSSANVKFAEIIMYNSALSDANATTIYNGLKARYGL